MYVCIHSGPAVDHGSTMGLPTEDSYSSPAPAMADSQPLSGSHRPAGHIRHKGVAVGALPVYEEQVWRERVLLHARHVYLTSVSSLLCIEIYYTNVKIGML